MLLHDYIYAFYVESRQYRLLGEVFTMTGLIGVTSLMKQYLSFLKNYRYAHVIWQHLFPRIGYYELRILQDLHMEGFLECEGSSLRSMFWMCITFLQNCCFSLIFCAISVLAFIIYGVELICTHSAVVLVGLLGTFIWRPTVHANAVLKNSNGRVHHKRILYRATGFLLLTSFI